MKHPVNVYGETQYWKNGNLEEISDGFGYKDNAGNITWYGDYECPPDDEFHLSFIVPYGNGCELSDILKNNT